MDDKKMRNTCSENGCSEKFVHNKNLRNHLINHHGLHHPEERLSFSSKDELLSWKTDEDSHLVNFIKDENGYGVKDGRIEVFRCNRSSTRKKSDPKKSKSEGKRNAKKTGSMKMDVVCLCCFYVLYKNMERSVSHCIHPITITI